jgi:hypothetical protein
MRRIPQLFSGSAAGRGAGGIRPGVPDRANRLDSPTESPSIYPAERTDARESSAHPYHWDRRMPVPMHGRLRRAFLRAGRLKAEPELLR